VDKRPLRVGLVILLASLALTAMLLTGRGGSADHAKVEASLGDYLSTLDPQACVGSGVCDQGAFPAGAGVPRVAAKSCKKTRTGPWSCFITYAHGKTALPVTVAVNGSGKVYWAAPMGGHLSPATVYQGGPGQSLP
jgi:hypothetical protein